MQVQRRAWRSDRARKKLINESKPPSEITGSRFDVLASSENSLQTLGEGQEGDSRGDRLAMLFLGLQKPRLGSQK